MIAEPLEERRHVHHAGAVERLLLAAEQRLGLLLLLLLLVPTASKAFVVDFKGPHKTEQRVMQSRIQMPLPLLFKWEITKGELAASRF